MVLSPVRTASRLISTVPSARNAVYLLMPLFSCSLFRFVMNTILSISGLKAGTGLASQIYLYRTQLSSQSVDFVAFVEAKCPRCEAMPWPCSRRGMRKFDCAVPVTETGTRPVPGRYDVVSILSAFYLKQCYPEKTKRILIPFFLK